jgi:hypothetical protein
MALDFFLPFINDNFGESQNNVGSMSWNDCYNDSLFSTTVCLTKDSAKREIKATA